MIDYVLKNAEDNADSVLATIDKFCWSTQWMMHIGDIKGKIVDETVLKYKPKKILELGTYCGYSSIRMARLIDPDGVIYTIDPWQAAIDPLLQKSRGI